MMMMVIVIVMVMVMVMDSKISKNISFLEASLMMVASKHNALKSSFSE